MARKKISPINMLKNSRLIRNKEHNVRLNLQMLASCGHKCCYFFYNVMNKYTSVISNCHFVYCVPETHLSHLTKEVLSKPT